MKKSNEYTINLVEIINQAGMEFSSQDAKKVEEIYSRCKASKIAINNIFVTLTGYSLPTLLKMAKAKRYTELNAKAQKVARRNYAKDSNDPDMPLIEAHGYCLDINDELLYMEKGQGFDTVQHDIIEVLNYHGGQND